MIISLRLKNFFSLRDDAALDFTADTSSQKLKNLLPENLIEFSGDKFVNILGLFGGNATGKSNIIKALDFCRNLVLTSHLNNEGDELKFKPFKFSKGKISEFEINFVTEGVEYEYSFGICDGNIVREELYHYPNRRRAKVFSRMNTDEYSHRKGLISRPGDVEKNTGSRTLFISRASSMNRELAQRIYRFFLNEMTIGFEGFRFDRLEPSMLRENKDLLLKAFEVSDSDIVDITLVEKVPGQWQLKSYHKEDPTIPFDFETEESEGTKRLLSLLLMLIEKSLAGATFFLDEFDLKLHLRLAEFLLDFIRATGKSQLVFTSHNSNLMDMTRMRPEQIIFVSKQQDGNSEFVPLSDYVGRSEKTDIQKAYLQGRFDGVPYIGDVYSILSGLIKKN